MIELQTCVEDFDATVFDEEANELLEEVCGRELRDCPNEWADGEMYFDLSYAIECLFDDLDFLMIPDLQARRELGDASLEHYYGINIDHYFEILPLDIQHK